MSQPGNSRVNSRLWLFAGIGAVIGAIAGFLMGAPLTIPFAILGFALGMGLRWILPVADSSAADSAAEDRPDPTDNS
ncbi:hypothetical protein [Brevibacterium linens]|uniref:hypothetical protein n=1 Tax=Brevibacterium linens TaxID=1703 RepID=UPI003F8C948D